MPQARKSARSSSRKASSYKEPAALKRLNRSLKDAQTALTQLRTQAGGSATQGTRALHKGVGKFISDARRDTVKFTTALKKDFDQAQKAAKTTRSSGTGASSARRSTRKTAAGSTRRTAASSTRKATASSTRKAPARRSTRKAS